MGLKSSKSLEPCNCKICVRTRKFKAVLKRVTNDEDKKFLETLFDSLNDLEDEMDYLEIYLENLRTLYPKVYREIHTVEKLKNGDENFPELNV